MSESINYFSNSNLQANSQASFKQSPRFNNLSTLKKPVHVLDKEERELIYQSGNLTKEQIWEKLEEKRFNQLQSAAVNLQGNMIQSQRCPKCTLPPPCKHYQTSLEIFHDAQSLLHSANFKKHLSPKRREALNKIVKDQKQNMSHNEGETDHQQEQEGNDIEGGQLSKRNHSKMMSITEQNPDQIKRSIRSNRNMHNQTANQTNRSVSEYRGAGGIHHNSALSHYGNQVLNQQKKQFLRKRQGNGGSPLNSFVQESPRTKLTQNMIPTRDNDRTTVRIRTKNNQFQYFEGSITQPLKSVSNQRKGNFNFNGSQYRKELLDEEWMKQQREHLQFVLASYKEEKIQRQIQKIEEEKLQIQQEKEKERLEEMKRKRYLDAQKQRIAQYQEQKYQEDRLKREIQKEEEMRAFRREQQRKSYFDKQKQMIQEYRDQKRQTDMLLLMSSQSPVNRFPNVQQSSTQSHFNQRFPIKDGSKSFDLGYDYESQTKLSQQLANLNVPLVVQEQNAEKKNEDQEVDIDDLNPDEITKMLQKEESEP